MTALGSFPDITQDVLPEGTIHNILASRDYESKALLCRNPHYEFLIPKVLEAEVPVWKVFNYASANPNLTKETVSKLIDKAKRQEELVHISSGAVENVKRFLDSDLLNHIASDNTTHRHGAFEGLLISRFNELNPENQRQTFINNHTDKRLFEKHPELTKQVMDDLIDRAKEIGVYNGWSVPGIVHNVSNKFPQAITDKAARVMAGRLRDEDWDRVNRNINWPKDVIEKATKSSQNAQLYFAQATHTPADVLEDLAANSPGAYAAIKAADRISPQSLMETYNRFPGKESARTALLDSKNLNEDMLYGALTSEWDRNLAEADSSATKEILSHASATPELTTKLITHVVRTETDPQRKQDKLEELLRWGQFNDHNAETLVTHTDLTPERSSYSQKLDDLSLSVSDQKWPELKQKIAAKVGDRIANGLDDWRHKELSESRPAVDFSVNSNRVRKARYLANQNGGSIHENDLKGAGLDLRAIGHGKAFDTKGNLTNETATNYLNAMPKERFHYETGTYDHEYQRHDNHRYEEPQKVFKVIMTPQQKQSLKRQGLWKIYADMFNQIDSAGIHPLAGNGGIGWVRYTQGKDTQPHIDEIQTDFHTGSANFKDLSYNEKAKWKKIEKVLFGNKNPTDLIHEAFHQHLRDTGHVTDAQPIKTHLFDVKAKQTKLGDLDPERDPPVHSTNTYRNFPQRIGYTPDTYGSAATQDNPEWQGQPTHSMDVYKSEIFDWLVGNKLTKAEDQLYTDYKRILNRFEAPVKALSGDLYGYPEFKAAKMLNPSARFNEANYREGLRIHGDDMVWAAIFAYSLPPTQQTHQELEQLMRLYV